MLIDGKEIKAREFLKEAHRYVGREDFANLLWRGFFDDTAYFFKHFERLAALEGAKPVLLMLARFRPDLFYQYADKIAGTHLGEELLLHAAEHGFWANPFEHMAVMERLPAALRDKLIAFSVERHPYRALIYHENFKHWPQADAILRQAISHAEPDDLLHHAAAYAHFPDAQEILHGAMQKAGPRALIAYYPTYAHLEGAKEAVLAAAEKDPEGVLFCHERLAGLPEAESLIRRAAEQSPAALIEAARRPSFQKLPYSKELLSAALLREPQMALKNIHLWRAWPEAASILKAVAEKDPVVTIRSYDAYKDIEDAPELLKKATESHPREALQYATLFHEHPEVEEILAAAAKKEPETAIACCAGYKHMWNGSKILRDAAEADPRAAIQHFLAYADHPDAVDILREACFAAPKDAVKYYHTYAHLPEAPEMLKQARSQLPMGGIRVAGLLLRSEDELAAMTRAGGKELSLMEKIHPGKAIGLAGVAAVTGLAMAAIGSKGPGKQAQSISERRGTEQHPSVA